MRKLPIETMLDHLRNGITFEAEAIDGSFYIRINDYVPYVCAAIHEGHQLREHLHDRILLSDYERWYEEDPHTGDFVASFPIVIRGQDSRYEYDLNRPPDKAIYDIAWGKQVWKSPLSDEEKQVSLDKYHQFYRVVDVLIDELVRRFEGCVVFDMHSYNYKRHDRPTPVFNIGAERVDMERYGRYVEYWRKELSTVKLPNLETTSEINDIFYGRGYFLEHITQQFPDALVLATEVKKIYCDEEHGVAYPEVISALKFHLKRTLLNTALRFIKDQTNLKVVRRNKLLSKAWDPVLVKVDQELYRLLRNFELLHYINPLNTERMKQAFFQTKFRENPVFRYPQLTLNPFELKRKLYRLPVEQIGDIHIQTLYKDLINAYGDKIDLLSTLGTDRFQYNSLRYFGEPSDQDLNNARFILYSADLADAREDEILDSREVHQRFRDAADLYGFDLNIQYSTKMVAKALVLNHKKRLVLKKDAPLSQRTVEALIHHEIGVHMVTTHNAIKQPLEIFRLGLPVNTHTQEGLAILSEYLSGTLTVARLKELALRVLAVYHMLRGYDFRRTFLLLHEEYDMAAQDAYYMTTRVYRGGGFTKDYLYLRGFRDILAYYQKGGSLDPLLLGKVHWRYRDILQEMIERRLAAPPYYRPLALAKPQTDNIALNYILQALR